MNDEVICFLKKEIKKKNIPGLVIKVTQKNDVLLKKALGWRIDFNNEKEPMQLDTVFDLASLTKVVATLPAILKLVDSGVISLKDPVFRYLPEFKKNNKEKITLFNLLTHTSGLPSYKRFHLEDLNRKNIANLISQDNLIYPTDSKVIYSDLGFILLSEIIKKVTTLNISEFTKQEIFNPLEMLETEFKPNFSMNRYAATEYEKSIESYKLGTVHDENAEVFGGISGHAGLFSTADDLSKFAKMIENNGAYKNKRILSERIIKLSRKNLTKSKGVPRGLGWQLKPTNTKINTNGYFSEESYGHTGFTGTSIWFDPTQKINVILLTNRVHYGRQVSIDPLRIGLYQIINKHV